MFVPLCLYYQAPKLLTPLYDTKFVKETLRWYSTSNRRRMKKRILMDQIENSDDEIELSGDEEYVQADYAVFLVKEKKADGDKLYESRNQTSK